MRTLIIGVGGYIGRNLLLDLQKRNADVIGFDRASFDLTRPEDWPIAWSQFQGPVDCVVHAAGKNVGDKSELQAVNSTSALPLARFLNDRRVGKLVYLSTGRVYGQIEGRAHTGMPASPVADYETSKFDAEKILLANFDGRLSVVRLYYPYGRDQDSARFIPRMIDAIRNGRPIKCRPDGGPELSVTYIEDLCRALIENFIYINSPPLLENIASDNIVSVRGLAEAIANELGTYVKFDTSGTSINEVSEPYPGIYRSFELSDIIPAD